MTEANSGEGSFVFIREILADVRVSDRCIRKWIAAGKFPPPAGNLHGRNFWLREQLERWRADVLAGRYKRERIAWRGAQHSEGSAS